MNLLIDISHLLKWEGRLTGIERVEYNIVNYYLDKGAGFIYWDDQKSSWVEANLTFVRQHIIERDKQPAQSLASITMRIKRKLKIQQDDIQGKNLDIRESYVLVPAGLWDNEAYIKALEDLSVHNDILHVVHDMIPILCPGFVVDYLPDVFANYMYRILPISSVLLANSENTKIDTVKVLTEAKLDVPPTQVFRLGDDIETKGKDERPEGIPSEYLLCVGTIEARKNHQLFAYVYRLAREKDIEIPAIIMAGRRGWHTDNFLQMAETDPYLKHKVIVMDSINDESLRWLYRNAILTIFPSLYEGWGLPVAESLAYGRVTLSSSTSSMPEVGGNSADYFSPNSPEELLNLIKKYLDVRMRSRRESQIREKFSLTTWTDSLKNLDEQINKIINRKND